MTYLRRHAEEALLAWYKGRRRKPLVIRGARQVGKSTLVEQFCKQNRIQLIGVNLERHKELDQVFETNDPDRIIREIQALTGRNPKEDGTILFLDEIQAIPGAISSLRYFLEEEPSLPVLAAGSLLEFALARRSFTMPVGRIEYLHLGPLTFEEYLEAFERDGLTTMIREWVPGKGIPEMAHRQLDRFFREFLFVGGMPEAVAVTVEENDIVHCREVHRSLCQTYEDDFAKYARGAGLLRLEKVFRRIPRLIGQKVKFVNIDRQERSVDLRIALDLLSKAGIVSLVHHSNCSGIPLGADIRDTVYKLLFLDVGLMNAQCRLDWRDLDRLDEVSLVNEGSIAEQFVGQHLLYRLGPRERPGVHYWQREGRRSNAEVDYVISCGRSIVPIEVKAGASGTLKSLYQLVAKAGSPLCIRLDRNLPSLTRVAHQIPTAEGIQRVRVELLSLPLYLAGQIDRLARSLSGG